MLLKNFPREIQEKIKQLQNMQNQLQIINSQLDLSQGRINEHKSTLKELEDVAEDTQLFKNVGQIMFSSDVPTIKKELTEEVELTELKLKTLKKQEEKIRSQITELNSHLNSVLGTQPSQT